MALPPDSPWLSSDNATLQKIIDVPSNTTPVAANVDCLKVTSKIYGTRSADDCVVQTPIAAFGTNGVTFNGSDYTAPVSTEWSPFYLQGIPHQQTTYILNYGATKGNYISFYKSFMSSLKPQMEIVNSRQTYMVVNQPDFRLRDQSGKLLEINTSTIAFSQNGQWMVVEAYGVGFVRINTTTFEVMSFAPSANPNPSDYNIHYSQLAITDDGSYAAVKPTDEHTFSIYDINSCQDAPFAIDPHVPKCKSRDYFSFISTSIANFNNGYQLRFSGDNNLNFLVVANDLANSTSTIKKYTMARYTLAAPGTSSSSVQYLALGDSYASGQGTFSYDDGTDTSNNDCHTSPISYPFLLRSNSLTDVHSVACSGAVTEDIVTTDQNYTGQVHDSIIRGKRKNIDGILNDYVPGYIAQREFLDAYNPQAITLSIGGNDIGFADIVKKCVLPSFTQPTCYASKEDQTELANRINALAAKLAETYQTVSAPGRRVFVIGYPQIVVADGNCAINVHLDANEINLFIGLTNQLNKVIRQTAENNGATYVDVSAAFVGHRMCETKSSQVAVNGLTAGTDSGIGALRFIGAESYHPNALGHQLLADAIRRQVGDLIATDTTPVTPPSSDVSLPLPGASSDNRPVRTTTVQGDMTPDVLQIGDPVSISGDTDVALLRPHSTVKVMIDGTITAASGTVDAMGAATANFTLPSTTSGLHTISVSGTTIAGQPIDISKEVFIVSDGDTAVDGTQCGFIPLSGVDADADGIDDACDPVIDEPSHALYVVYLKGSSIHAMR